MPIFSLSNPPEPIPMNPLSQSGLYNPQIYYHPLSSLNLLPFYHLLLRYQTLSQLLIHILWIFQRVLHFRVNYKLLMVLIIDTLLKIFWMVSRLALSTNLIQNLLIQISIGFATFLEWLSLPLPSMALPHLGLPVSLKLIPEIGPNFSTKFLKQFDKATIKFIKAQTEA